MKFPFAATERPAAGLHVSRVSIQETVPRSLGESASVHTYLPAPGRSTRAREGSGCPAGLLAYCRPQVLARSLALAFWGRGMVWLGGGATPCSTQAASASRAARTQGSIGRSTVLPYSSTP